MGQSQVPGRWSAGWEEDGNVLRPLFLQCSGPQAGGGRAMLGWGPLPTQQPFILQSHPSSLSLCPFPTFPSCCLRAGLKSWKKAVSVPSLCPLKVSTLLWAFLCLVQGGHRWRKTNHALGVSQAWRVFSLLAHPAPARELFLSFCPSKD